MGGAVRGVLPPRRGARAGPANASFRAALGRVVGETGQRTQGRVNSVDYEEFVDRVRQQAGLASSSEAETAVRATLTTLGEHLDEEPDLVSRLPEELAEHLRREPSGRIVSSWLDTFMEEVGKREGANTDEASASPPGAISCLQDARGYPLRRAGRVHQHTPFVGLASNVAVRPSPGVGNGVTYQLPSVIEDALTD